MVLRVDYRVFNYCSRCAKKFPKVFFRCSKGHRLRTAPLRGKIRVLKAYVID